MKVEKKEEEMEKVVDHYGKKSMPGPGQARERCRGIHGAGSVWRHDDRFPEGGGRP